MTTLILTPKEIHILVQIIRVYMEEERINEFAKHGEIVSIRNKLQNVKD